MAQKDPVSPCLTSTVGPPPLLSGERAASTAAAASPANASKRERASYRQQTPLPV